MKTQFLLPAKFKSIGMWMFLPFMVMAILEFLDVKALAPYINWELSLPYIYDNFFTHDTWFSFHNDSVYNEIWIIGLLLSLTFIALAKEKDEDEMINKIRLESMAWALWGIVILFALETLWVFGWGYMESTFLTLFIYLILFISKFNYEMFKLKRD